MQASPSRPASSALLTGMLLALLMLVTRLGHFGELSRLPDASWAVFFLGGLLLRDARAFAGFLLLAWLVDLAAVALGTPADCFSVAYLFLLPAHAMLWWAGRAGAKVWGLGHWRALAGTLARLALAVSAAFVVSNAGFLAFGPVDAGMSASAYAAAVVGYLPGYLLVAATWVVATLALHGLALPAREVRVAR
jgi:hypothetical protein